MASDQPEDPTPNGRRRDRASRKRSLGRLPKARASRKGKLLGQSYEPAPPKRGSCLGKSNEPAPPEREAWTDYLKPAPPERGSCLGNPNEPAAPERGGCFGKIQRSDHCKPQTRPHLLNKQGRSRHPRQLISATKHAPFPSESANPRDKARADATTGVQRSLCATKCKPLSARAAPSTSRGLASQHRHQPRPQARFRCSRLPPHR